MTRIQDMSICVIGLGQIGGSLAKAFRHYGVGREVVGVDRDHAAAQEALRIGIVDGIFARAKSAVKGRHIVILAAPVGEIVRMIRPLSSVMDKGSILMDVGSTKRAILGEMRGVRSGIDCIGGHPMCGTEASGLEASSERLFQNAPFIMVPAPHCQRESSNTVAEIVKRIGAKPCFLSAENHDRIMATISHLPYVLSVALMRLCQDLGADSETAMTLAAGGFLGSTRLAESEPVMAADFCMTNSDNLDSAMTAFTKNAEGILGLARRQKSRALVELLGSVRCLRRKMRRSSSPEPQSAEES